MGFTRVPIDTIGKKLQRRSLVKLQSEAKNLQQQLVVYESYACVCVFILIIDLYYIIYNGVNQTIWLPNYMVLGFTAP